MAMSCGRGKTEFQSRTKNCRLCYACARGRENGVQHIGISNGGRAGRDWIRQAILPNGRGGILLGRSGAIYGHEQEGPIKAGKTSPMY